jgi:hypothetical protein
MTTRVIPLQALAQRINQQQAELAQLRQEYEARQADLRRFTLRKEQLQAELARVEAEIRGLAQGAKPPPGVAPTAGHAAPKRPVAKAASAKPGPTTAQPLTLPGLLLQIVREATGPMTVKKLTEEAQRRNYVTTSKNLAALVDTRISELIKKKLVRRAKNQPGVVAVPSSAKGPTPPGKVAPPAAAAQAKKAVMTKSTPKTASAASKSGPSLTSLIAKILGGSSEPVPARELAAKVLATGYQTKSKDFTNVIWVAVAKMDNVENVSGRGYRLKKGKKS